MNYFEFISDEEIEQMHYLVEQDIPNWLVFELNLEKLECQEI